MQGRPRKYSGGWVWGLGPWPHGTVTQESVRRKDTTRRTPVVSVKKDIGQAGGRSPREQEESGRLDALELAHGNTLQIGCQGHLMMGFDSFHHLRNRHCKVPHKGCNYLVDFQLSATRAKQPSLPVHLSLFSREPSRIRCKACRARRFCQRHFFTAWRDERLFLHISHVKQSRLVNSLSNMLTSASRPRPPILLSASVARNLISALASSGFTKRTFCLPSVMVKDLRGTTCSPKSVQIPSCVQRVQHTVTGIHQNARHPS